MADQELDQQFVENQRERLVGLRDELVRIKEGMSDDERTSARPRGDYARLWRPEPGYVHPRDGRLHGEQVERRLREVDRALQKVEEGTYGLSDDSGETIPRGRLEPCPKR